MKLATYLENEEMTDAAFARLIGVERQAVGRYKLGERFPETPVLLKIYEATGGLVTANDFAGIPDGTQRRRAKPPEPKRRRTRVAA